ncbi:hypothetical protein LIER_27119 [Lithospermum erythrorhizon]|uniref:Uncharacterized protein n=1 Tax=Lithospermum erythrorhizon TaxID=34254 RepID=A0AAV3REV7_LITER
MKSDGITPHPAPSNNILPQNTINLRRLIPQMTTTNENILTGRVARSPVHIASGILITKCSPWRTITPVQRRMHSQIVILILLIIMNMKVKVGALPLSQEGDHGHLTSSKRNKQSKEDKISRKDKCKEENQRLHSNASQKEYKRQMGRRHVPKEAHHTQKTGGVPNSRSRNTCIHHQGEEPPPLRGQKSGGLSTQL